MLRILYDNKQSAEKGYALINGINVLKMRVFVVGVKLWYTTSSELYMVILQHTSSAEYLDIEDSYVRVYEDQMLDRIQKVTFRVTYFM